jgi:hypothetical protein
MNPHTDKLRARSWRFGALLQGIILGALVWIAVIELVATSDNVRIFRYQAF